jgi:ABC-type transport system involved in multi-copper enzyme maturation permease subunit
MTFLPLVERELRVAARLRRTYWTRAIAAGVLTVVAMAMLVFGVLSSFHSQVGKAMFHTLSYLTMLLCFLEGARRTADCLSSERREGTLGLLFLTDLRGYDVVLGKLAATSLNGVYSLLALLPILALSLLMGGVTQAEFWRMSLALLSILFLSLCIGIWASAYNRVERQALGITLGFMLAVGLGPLLVGQAGLDSISPVTAYRTSFEAVYKVAPSSYWNSILITHGLSWVLLVWASLVLPGRFQRDFASTSQPGWWKRWFQGNPGKPEQRTALRTRQLNINPAYWLASRNTGQALPIYLLTLAIILLFAFFVWVNKINWMGAYLFCVVAINFLLKTWVAGQSCRCLAEARQNNALEMLLSTPLTVEDIIRGQVLALKRAFLLPILLIFSIEIGVLLLGIFFLDNNSLVASMGFSMFFGLVYLAIFTLDIFALCWSGMWFGLSSKNETTAIAKTIGFVLLLPLVSVFFWCFGAVFFVGWPIFWIIYSSQKIRSEFRNWAIQRYHSKTPESRWSPVVGQQIPPAIPTPQP